MAEKDSLAEVLAIHAELQQQTDRGAALIAAAILEEELTEALHARLILTPRISQRLFSLERLGAISDFGTKIDVAFAVGLIRTAAFDDLHLIRRIRNHFAHKKEPLRFDTPQIAEWCNTLNGKGDAIIPRHRYMIAFGRLTALLIVLKRVEGLRLQTAAEDEKIRPKFDELLKSMISDEP
jgi:hypothetical protein